jgi:hypothetical protein
MISIRIRSAGLGALDHLEDETREDNTSLNETQINKKIMEACVYNKLRNIFILR